MCTDFVLQVRMQARLEAPLCTVSRSCSEQFKTPSSLASGVAFVPMAISAVRRRLGVLTVRCQALSLLGRLEALGLGSAAAAGRRWHTRELERCWRREHQAGGGSTRLEEGAPGWRREHQAGGESPRLTPWPGCQAIRPTDPALLRWTRVLFCSIESRLK